MARARAASYRPARYSDFAAMMHAAVVRGFRPEASAAEPNAEAAEEYFPAWNSESPSENNRSTGSSRWNAAEQVPYGAGSRSTNRIRGHLVIDLRYAVIWSGWRLSGRRW